MTIDLLPLQNVNLETPLIFKKLIEAHRFLASVKESAKRIPNETILINTLCLQEAKDSSAIENIITTHDDLYRNQILNTHNLNAKEVDNYGSALQKGFELVKNHGYLSLNFICEIQSELEKNRAGFRTTLGTTLQDNQGNVVYTPPQNYNEIIVLMSNLEKYINNPEIQDFDPLIKMAIIHHQFESIHPFYDGNGRTGRIINVLYLVLNQLLDIPILYLSRYIIQHKHDYYRLLQSVRDLNNWEEWVLFMLDSVISVSKETLLLINQIYDLFNEVKIILKEQVPKIYSKDLLESLFKHPYTKTDFLVQDLGKHRNTISVYLNILCEINILEKHSIGKKNYYINHRLFNLFVHK